MTMVFVLVCPRWSVGGVCVQTVIRNGVLKYHSTFAGMTRVFDLACPRWCVGGVCVQMVTRNGQCGNIAKSGAGLNMVSFLSVYGAL